MNGKIKNIVLIGSGNLATNVGKALHAQGYRIMQVYSYREETAKMLADVLETAYTINLTELRNDADLYITALKDSVLPELLPEIVKGREQALFVHTAGSVPMNIWEGHAQRYGVFYPMQTFSKAREVCFDEIPFFIEANNENDLNLLKSLALGISRKVYEASSEQRKSLHLAAVFTCNFTNHMYALAGELLAKYDLPFEAMLPLVDETAKKVHELSPVKAQTGPAVRYDANVINKHLAMLADEPSMRELYEKISKSIHELKLKQND